jgi:hypothetical protein
MRFEGMQRETRRSGATRLSDQRNARECRSPRHEHIFRRPVKRSEDAKTAGPSNAKAAGYTREVQSGRRGTAPTGVERDRAKGRGRSRSRGMDGAARRLLKAAAVLGVSSCFWGSQCPGPTYVYVVRNYRGL